MSLSPTSTLGTLRPDVRMAMSEFDLVASRAGFVGPKIAPVFEVGEQSGPYPVIPMETYLQEVASLARTQRGAYPRVNLKFGQGSYYCEESGIEIPLDNRAAKVYKNWFDWEVACAMISRDMILRSKEVAVATMALANASVTNAAVATVWSDHTGSTPLVDVDNRKIAIRAATGIIPNAIVCPYTVYLSHLRYNSQILDRIMSQGAGSSIKADAITTAILASVFDVEHFIVADAMRNQEAANKDAALTEVWDVTKVLVCRIAPQGSNLQVPSFMRTLHWAEDGSDIGAMIDTYESNETRGRVIRARIDTDEKYWNVLLGNILTGVTA